MTYTTIRNFGEDSFEEKKSEFIGYAKRVESEEEAREKWNELVQQIGNIKWTGWVIKSAIKEWEEI